MSSLKFDLTAIEADRKTIYTIYGKDRVFTELAICLNCVPACWSYDKKSRVFWTTTMCSNACGQREWISECVPYLEKRLGSSKRQLRRLLTCKTSKRDAIPDLEDKTVSLIWISKKCVLYMGGAPKFNAACAKHNAAEALSILPPKALSEKAC